MRKKLFRILNNENNKWKPTPIKLINNNETSQVNSILIRTNSSLLIDDCTTKIFACLTYLY